jgi:hypothetical protein
MNDHGMTAIVKFFGCRPHDGGAADTGAGVRKHRADPKLCIHNHSTAQRETYNKLELTSFCESVVR